MARNSSSLSVRFFATAAVLLSGLAGSQAQGQTAALALDSASAYAGQSVSVDLTFSGGPAAGVQWQLEYTPGDIASVDVVPGPAATGAGKSIYCNSEASAVTCLLVGGDNALPIPAGVVATANIVLTPPAAGIPASRASDIRILTPVASSEEGDAVPVAPSDGTITILSPGPSQVSPVSISLLGGQSQQFSAGMTANWTISPAMGAISADGLYTAPAVVSTDQTVTVRATNPSDSQFFATASIALQAVSVQLSPTSVTLGPSQTRQFTATVIDALNPAVTWSLSPAVGTVSSTGLYTAPATITTAQTVTLRAASVQDPSKSKTAAITLQPPAAVSVSVTPGSASLGAGQSQQFTASVTGTTTTGVTWSISPATGTITTGGRYTAPATVTSQQTVTVKATSVADATKSATAVVTLNPPTTTPPSTLSLTPAATTLAPSQSQQFAVITTAGSGGNAAATQETRAAATVTWSITPALGSISSAGLYKAPASVTTKQTITVTAKMGTSSGSAAVTLQPATATPGGLVAAYGFEEGTGTTTKDKSGNNNNGQIGTSAWTASGKFGKALTFNGTNSMVTVNDSASLDLTTGMTVMAWVRPTLLGGYQTVLMKEVPGDNAWALDANDNINRPGVWIRVGSTTHSVKGSQQLPLNRWTHIAGTYDGTRLRFYVNGTLVGSKAISGPMVTSNSPLRFGGNGVWSDEWFKGALDEIRVYSRALTAAEVQQNMNTAVGP